MLNSHAFQRDLTVVVVDDLSRQLNLTLVVVEQHRRDNGIHVLLQPSVPSRQRTKHLHHKILFANLECVKAEELLLDLNSFRAKNVIVDGVKVNLSISYGNDGELLYLIGTVKARYLEKAYKRRWSIEVFFQALKKRGFNLEESSLRCLKKYRKLFAVVCIAYTICWATGIQDGKKNPVRVKKHGYPQYSVFRRGLNLMRKFYKNQIREPIVKAILAAEERTFKNLLKTVG